jgi:hypothetical protein
MAQCAMDAQYFLLNTAMAAEHGRASAAPLRLRLSYLLGLFRPEHSACIEAKSASGPSIYRQLVPFVHMKEAPFMHEDAHRKAAGQHKLAAQAHRTAAEHNKGGDNDSGNWHSQRALEYPDRAYRLAKEAHAKSGRIVSLHK